MKRPTSAAALATLLFAAAAAAQPADTPPAEPNESSSSESSSSESSSSEPAESEAAELMPAPDPGAMEPVLRKALADGDGFCSKQRGAPKFEELPLCSLAEAARERCPEFARACAEATRRDRSGERSSRSPRGVLSALLGTVLTVLFWGVAALGLVVVLGSLANALMRRRAAPAAEPEPDPTAPAEARPLRAPETADPTALLQHAEALARAGALKEAMAETLRALLRSLEIRGALELHPSRTNGEYARRLGREHPLTQDFRGVVREVEAVEFGGERASGERFRALYERVGRLVHPALVLLVAASALLSSGCAGAPRQGGDSIASCGKDASGYAVFCEVLVEQDVAFRKRFQRLDAVPEDVDQVIVLEDSLAPSERAALLAWVELGGELLIKDRIAEYFPDHGVELAPFSTACGDRLTLEPGRFSPPEKEPRFRLPGARSLKDTFAEVLSRCGKEPFAVRSVRGDGGITVIADPRFLTNAALAIEHNAALAASLPLGMDVLLVGEWTGAGTEIPANAISRAGLLPWLLHLLLLGLAFALYRGAPFGSRRELVLPPRRAFAEHAEALGEAYARARASGTALAHFGSWALERLRLRTGAPGQARLDELASALSTRLSLREAEVTKLILTVRFAGDEKHDSASEAEHLAALGKLAALVRK